jgi:hypothetical protein
VSIDVEDFDPLDLARQLHEWGSNDLLFDALMVLGPLVVLAFTVGGRNAATIALVGAYVAGFVLALARNAAELGRD